MRRPLFFAHDSESGAARAELNPSPSGDAGTADTSGKIRLTPASRSLPYSCDELDQKILAKLASDAREPFLTIASSLGVDEKTVRYRVAKMRNAGFLHFQPLLNPNQLSRSVVLYVGIKLRPEFRKDPAGVAERIAEISQVTWCGAVMGGFDLLAEVCLESFEQVREFQLGTLQSIDAVDSCETFVVLSHHGRRGIPVMFRGE